MTLRDRWGSRLERPFWRLVQLFVERIFRGGGDSDSEGLDLGIGLVLTLLAMPGAFVSVLLFDKYGSLLQWLRGVAHVDTLQIAFPDEYFFIVLSMTVTGAVAVWRWDTILPDRRDFMNLAHLPISSRTIFQANLLAVLFLIGLVAVDVNGASCILFPMVASASQGTFMFFVKFGIIHAAGVFVASVFSFFAVFSVLGLFMALLSPRAFRRISSYARGFVVVYLVALLSTSFAIPDLLFTAKGSAPLWAFFLPSTWFVSGCQLLRHHANPAMAELARLCLPGVFVLFATAFVTYAIGYQRHFVKIAEIAEGSVGGHAPTQWIPLAFERYLFPTPFLRGCFAFVMTTLRRSESHRLVLTGVAGLALVLSSQALMNAFQLASSWQQAALTPDALSIPFSLSFLLIVGLRIVFEIPVEIRANWVFQFLIDPNGRECRALARRVMLLICLPGVLILTAGVYCFLESPLIAALHVSLVLAWSVLLANILLVRFRKLPFTCTLPVFKQHSIVILIALCFGYLLYAVSTPEFESSALLHPIQMLAFIPIAVVAWYVPRHLEKNTIDLERKLIFEESPTRTVEGLRLSE